MVELTRAISTGKSRTVASKEVNVIIVTVETKADLSRGVWYTYVNMAAMSATTPKATAYATHMKAV